MGEKQFKIIYGKFAGIEKRTVEMLVGGVADYMDYPVPVYGSGFISQEGFGRV